jgi:catechol 2,3-dioxygenase-like lactoylglutathione lyase family enzyme
MKSLVLVLLALAPAPALGQAAPSVLKTTGAFIGLSVADLDASARWYAEKLGLRVVFDPPAYEGVKAKVLEGGGLIVELVHNPKAVPLRTAAPGLTHTTLVHGIFKAGLIVDDYEQTLAALRARGVDIAMGPFPARDGQRANVIIRDNAGNLIQLFGK